VEYYPGERDGFRERFRSRAEIVVDPGMVRQRACAFMLLNGGLPLIASAGSAGEPAAGRVQPAATTVPGLSAGGGLALYLRRIRFQK
jgi:hypothetical protein